LGLWDKTLELTNRTQIETEGQRATLADIAEGVKVKASYETRVGKSFATHISWYRCPSPRTSKCTSKSVGPERWRGGMRSRAHLSVKKRKEERKGREFLHAIAVTPVVYLLQGFAPVEIPQLDFYVDES